MSRGHVASKRGVVALLVESFFSSTGQRGHQSALSRGMQEENSCCSNPFSVQWGNVAIKLKVSRIVSTRFFVPVPIMATKRYRINCLQRILRTRTSFVLTEIQMLKFEFNRWSCCMSIVSLRTWGVGSCIQRQQVLKRP